MPLKQAPANIAVIGPDADNLDALIGNYSGHAFEAGDYSRRNSQTVPAVEGGLRRRNGTYWPDYARLIPADALYVDETRKEHGLKGEYFSNMELERHAGDDAQLTAPSILPGAIPGCHRELPNNYSVRWTGVRGSTCDRRVCGRI